MYVGFTVFAASFSHFENESDGTKQAAIELQDAKQRAEDSQHQIKHVSLGDLLCSVTTLSVCHHYHTQES